MQILEKIKTEDLVGINSFLLQFNIDGLPLYKSSSGQIWPILARIKNLTYNKPFTVALFYVKSKPSNLHEYLTEFCEELKECFDTGFVFLDRCFNLEIDSFVCDTPAQAFLKNTKSHTGYFGCDRCMEEGEWHNKMTFPHLNALLRTDESFKSMLHAKHHKVLTPLVELGVGLVSALSLDYMHLVCLRVTRRLLLIWIKGPLKCRQSSTVMNAISSLCALEKHVPCEFARRPRTLKEIDQWKATEFWQFLLYSGLVVLSDKLPQHLYCNFVLLSVAIRILVSCTLCVSSMIDFAS